MNNYFQEYEPNKVGRDFVCGDIHGCYTDLYRELQKVSFDITTDRLFSVGDLADRGPESELSLEYIKQPWFHPVLGNHEEMFLQCWIECNEPRQWHYHNGGEWVQNLSFAQRQEYSKEIHKLPLIIRIGKVLICHSLLPKQTLDTIKENIERLHDFIIWQRDVLFNGGPDGFITYAGHTINDEVTSYGSVVDIDTGAFLKYWEGHDGHLTLVDITKQESDL